LLVGTIVGDGAAVVVLDKDCSCSLLSMANPIRESIQTKETLPTFTTQPACLSHPLGWWFVQIRPLLSDGIIQDLDAKVNLTFEPSIFVQIFLITPRATCKPSQPASNDIYDVNNTVQ
jgi:hypothetical protein